MKWSLLCALLVGLFVSGTSQAANLWGLKRGTPELQSAGVLTFGLVFYLIFARAEKLFD